MIGMKLILSFKSKILFWEPDEKSCEPEIASIKLRCFLNGKNSPKGTSILLSKKLVLFLSNTSRELKYSPSSCLVAPITSFWLCFKKKSYNIIVQEFINELNQLYNVEIKKISVADENITFKIPRELNES